MTSIVDSDPISDVDFPAADQTETEIQTENQTQTGTLLPPRVGVDYLAHQITGIRWMLEREEERADVCRGGILADDMGLGKTFQTIGLLKNSPFPLRTLIICPPALMAGWMEELRACGYGVWILGTGVAVWNRLAPTSVSADTVTTDIWLTSYPKAHMYRISMTDERFQRVILDEGHIIRNGKATQRWWTCMAIAKKATCRWILSATPVQNSYSDWRNLCWWLRVRCPDARIAQLADLLMLRRTMAELRDDIAALPPAPRFVSHDLTIPADEPEGKLFRVLCDQLSTLMDSRTVSGLIKLELYLRIQQFLVHPQIYVEAMRRKFQGAYPRPDWTGTATKWDAVHVQMQRAVSQKVPAIVFCQFSEEIDRVCEAARGLGAAVWSIRGGMSMEDIGKAVIDARAAASVGEEGVIVVVQIVSGGCGLNLQFCKRIFFLSQHWNPAVVHQAVGRAVRIGQSDPVEVHFFRIVDGVMDNIDRRMFHVHLKKIDGARKICDSLYDGYADLEDTFEESVITEMVVIPTADPVYESEPESESESESDPLPVV